MKEKIAYLMKSNDLTTTNFAELLETQPSTISHLVSGRNKPSYDILQKILRTFPRVNPDWLLLDAEEPYRQGQESDSPNLFDSQGSVSESNSAIAGNNNPFAALANRGANMAIQPQTGANTPVNRSSKSPIFVVVFYDDGSCENFSMR